MPRALNLLRHSIGRRPTFVAGLQAAGYEVLDRLDWTPTRDDVLLTWSRHGGHDETAQRFEACGARAIVAENGYLGKDWRGGEWFALALHHHAGAGWWPVGDASRWDDLNVPIAPWRRGGDEVVILGQRGIGERDVRSPDGWAEWARQRFGGRIRYHPGKDRGGTALDDDIAPARCVVTWNSGAALKALLLGVPVFYEFDGWIAAGACRHVKDWAIGPKRDDGDRLKMFRRLAWSIFEAEEIASGAPFRTLLNWRYQT